mgnify:CR=1 FL=1
MLLGGLWHGSAWGFILWGGLHGLFLVINYVWKRSNMRINLKTQLSIPITFLSITLAWVLFRAETLNSALHFYKTLFNFNTLNFLDIKDTQNLWIVFAMLIVWILPTTEQWIKKREITFTYGLIIGCIALSAIVQITNIQEFIYFQF